MAEGGLFLTLPVQSVLVRLLLGAVLAAVAVRLLLRSRMRVPSARVLAALLPALAAVAVVAISFTALRLPSLAVPTGEDGAIVVLIQDTYAFAAPLAVPLLLTSWLAIAALRIGYRLRHLLRAERRAVAAVESCPPPLHLRTMLRRVAARMGIDAPPLGLADGCPGGATVVGIRQPVVVVDAALIGRLDNEEFEAVLAHELAHVKRRDNLVALLWGLVRDVAVFLPGARWALRQFLVEREVAADQVAVTVTRRPGALASGLLKVLEAEDGGLRAHDVACAAFAPSATLVRRVELLVDTAPAAGRARRGLEITAVGVGLVAVVSTALVVPRLAAGENGESMVGVMVSPPDQASADVELVETYESPVFSTYRRSVLAARPDAASALTRLDDEPREVSRVVQRACVARAPTCEPPTLVPSLGLRPPPDVLDDPHLQPRWRARPVLETGEIVRIYWLSDVAR